jgi:FkbM family methyltransferase
MLPRFAKNAFQEFGIYDRLKASIVGQTYRRITDPSTIASERLSLDFLKSQLGILSGQRVFDIGANVGDKTDQFLRLGARVVAVEPDSTNCARLAQRFLRMRWRQPPLVIVHAAVSDRAGTVQLLSNMPGAAQNTLSRKWADTLSADRTRFGEDFSFAERQTVSATTLTNLIAAHGRPAFVKIDVEGHEWPVLRVLTQPLPMICFEVNLPEFRDEGRQCIQHLGSLDHDSQFTYTRGSDLHIAIPWATASAMVEALEHEDAPSIDVWCRTVR